MSSSGLRGVRWLGKSSKRRDVGDMNLVSGKLDAGDMGDTNFVPEKLDAGGVGDMNVVPVSLTRATWVMSSSAWAQSWRKTSAWSE